MRLACFVSSFLLAAAALAVEPLPGVLAVAGYSGADRSERLIAGARKEGELMIYSSLTPDDQLRLASDFKARYGVTLRFWRGSQTNILQRVLTETRGGRFEFDALETNSPQIEAMAREKLLQKMNSPFVDQVLLPQTLPPHGEWTPDRLNLLVYAYNTDALKRADLPKTWPQLLEPKWKRRLGMESTNVEWFAALVESMGEKQGLELFRRLGDNRRRRAHGHTHSTGRVIAGEIPVMLGVFSHDVDRMKAKGAPVDCSCCRRQSCCFCVAVSRRATHPHAAALFYDYMSPKARSLHRGLSRAGQQELRHARAKASGAAPADRRRQRAGSDRRLRQVARPLQEADRRPLHSLTAQRSE